MHDYESNDLSNAIIECLSDKVLYTKMLSEIKPVVFPEIHGPEAGEIVFNSFSSAGYQVNLLGKSGAIIRSYKDLGWKAYIVARPT